MGKEKIINMAKIKENLNSILSVLLFLMVGVIAFIIGKIILFSPSVLQMIMLLCYWKCYYLLLYLNYS